MKAQRLPSGSWNIKVLSHYKIVDGKKKRVYKSFTVSDPSQKGKRECERLAAEFCALRDKGTQNMSVYTAVKAYVDSKRNVLSPSTISAYDVLLGSAFSEIGALWIDNITQEDVQRWVNKCSVVDSPKTVRNKFALLQAAYKMHTGLKLEVSLPARKRPQLYTPTSEDITALLEHTRANPGSYELTLAIMLAAFCGLRMGEICALEASDFHDGILNVSKSRVKHTDGYYVTKQPKTYSSYRQVPVTSSIMEMVEGKKGRVINAESKVMTDRFRRAIRYTFKGTKRFRFHDLRHYYASVTHAIGIPDEYIMQTGGWKTDYVMKRVYRNALADETKRQSEKILNFFENNI